MTAEPDVTEARTIDVLRRQLAAAVAERDEAQVRQAALAEVLQAINVSPDDLKPVFDLIIDNALALCDSAFGALLAYESDRLTVVSHRNSPAALAEFWNRPQYVDPATAIARTLREGKPVQIADLRETASYRSGVAMTVASVELGDIRTFLQVPLMGARGAIGVFSLYRKEVRPFTDKQVALVQAFAGQAAIAMENARLLTERREALDQQAATAEILGVINASPGNLGPVFDVVLEKAMYLCDAASGGLGTWRGDRFAFTAERGLPQGISDFLAANRVSAGSRDGFVRLAQGAGYLQYADYAASKVYLAGDPLARATVDLGGARTLLMVPMVKDDDLLGILAVYRQEVRPFSDRQIALVRSFAAQAIIAMENVRLINETRAALEQQTAAAEILSVISSSVADTQPVFDKILQSCKHLFGGDELGVLLVDEQGQLNIGAYQGQAYDIVVADFPAPVERTPAGRAIRERRVVHWPDLINGEGVPGMLRKMAKLVGYRSVAFAPMLWEDRGIGAIGVGRSTGPFKPKELATLQTFADQAVIAIQNARLFNETKEALDQQTATTVVLQVINASAGDLKPVFDTMVDKAMALCDAAFGGLITYDGQMLTAGTLRNVPPALLDQWKTPQRLDPSFPMAQPLLERRTVHVPDLAASEAYRAGLQTTAAGVEIGGIRTVLWVPLLSDRGPLGLLAFYRQEVRPFTDKQIALIEAFAAQAVMAMENARLLGELTRREAELSVTFEHMGDGVVMFDSDLCLASWNRNFQQLLDVPDDFLAGRPGLDDYVRLLVGRGEMGVIDADHVVASYRKRVDQTWSAERTRPDGRVIEVRNNPVPGGGVVLIYGDITERKKAEAEIAAARDAAEAALDKLKAAQANLVQSEKMASLGQLTAGIAHEIKNPLNFVNNFAILSVELLDELKEVAGPALAELDKDKRAELDETMTLLTGNLEKITEHGKRADGIVRSMLSHSRGGAGEWQPSDINALVEEALNLAYHGVRAHDKDFNVTLERDFEKTGKPIDVVPQDVTRVFLNLFGNGFYAANKRRLGAREPGFRPTIKVTTRETGDGVEVKVRDNGAGIPPEVREKLFQPFFTTKPTGEGTGLGLSISYDIVTQQHGGTIEVESEPGSFTEFTVRLPRSRRVVPGQ